jgi:hypothetical protein
VIGAAVFLFGGFYRCAVADCASPL